jgi:hypothetical protein
MNFSANLYALIVGYLTVREIMIRTSHQKKIREVKRGCPQRSLLGPLFWNVVMDEYLTAQSRFREDRIAYADDLAVTVKANRGPELERRMVGATSSLSQLLRRFAWS